MARTTLKLKRPITDIEIDIDENSLYALGYKKIKEFKTENNYIEKEDAITAVGEAIADGKPWFDALLNIPTVDMVSASAYRQVTWERDVAISQLQEIGKGLGENMNDVVKQRKGKWILKQEYDISEEDGEKYWECSLCGCGSDSYDTTYHTNFCPNCGARMVNNDI